MCGCSTGFDRVTNKFPGVLAVMSSGDSDGEKCEEVVTALDIVGLVEERPSQSGLAAL